MIVTLFVCLLLASVHAEEASYAEDSPVTVLTADNFDQVIKEGVVLVEFFAPWCGHCKHLKPVYEEAATKIKESGLKAVLAALDATAHREIAEKYGIEGFPTIKFFKDGEYVKDYEGGRTADSLISFIETQLLPVIIDVSTMEDYKAKTEDKLAVFVAHFDKQHDKVKDAVFKAADIAKTTLEFVRFINIVDESLAKELKLTATPVLKVIRQWVDITAEDEPVEATFDFFTDAGFDADSIAAWIAVEAFPILAEVTPENFGLFSARNLPLFWQFVTGHTKNPPFGEGDPIENTPEEAEKQKAELAAARAAAKDFKGRITVFYLSGVDYREHASQLGLSIETLPGAVIMDNENSKRYVFEGEYTAANLKQWLTDYFDGKVAPSIKSEEPPAENNGPVKTLVAKTFDELVWKADKDVFIKFYAPWCGHCKAVAPTWEQLGKMFQNEPGFAIAEIDAAANDVFEEVTGFPTFYFKKKGAAPNKVDSSFFYNGGRELEDFLAFIKEHASFDTSSIKIPPNYDKIRTWLSQFEDVKKEIEKVLDEVAPIEKPAEEPEEEEEEEELDGEEPAHEEL